MGTGLSDEERDPCGLQVPRRSLLVQLRHSGFVPTSLSAAAVPFPPQVAKKGLPLPPDPLARAAAAAGVQPDLNFATEDWDEDSPSKYDPVRVAAVAGVQPDHNFAIEDWD